MITVEINLYYIYFDLFRKYILIMNECLINT